MAPIIPRLHLLEVNDQSWFPDFLRARVQSCLTLLWTFRIPILQPCSPASLVAQTLLRLLGEDSAKYTYVDFCSGAGGPTLAIEKEFNARLATDVEHEIVSEDPSVAGSITSTAHPTMPTPTTSPDRGVVDGKLTQRRSKRLQDQGLSFSQKKTIPKQAYFVLTDIAPHLSAWSLAATQSSHIRYVASSIDASSASLSLLNNVSPSSIPTAATNLPIFRLFSLAFHHFDDTLAYEVLANTLETSSGFAILELQGRSFSSQVMTMLLCPLLLVISPLFFWRDPIHLLFSYLLPIVPFVVALDGMVSSLRTRTGEEVKGMVERVIRERGLDVGQWDVIWGSEWHTWPIGEMTWVVGLKRDDKKA